MIVAFGNQGDPMSTLSHDREAADLLAALVRIVRTTRSLAHRRTQAMGPSGTPYSVLKVLAEGEARPGDLAARLCVSPSVVSRALVPLEALGLIERRHDDEDARAWRVALSEHGRRRLEAQQREYVSALADALVDWDAEELRVATCSLTRLDDVLTANGDALRQTTMTLSLPEEAGA
jgi:DNA-binding MarR family transcriptional regulator